MRRLIENVKETPIDLRVLQGLVPRKCKAVLYTDLDKPRNEVFKDNEGLAVLIPHAESEVGHFVVLLPRKKAKASHIEYYSSRGGSPTEELDKLHQSHEIMMKLLGNKFIYNTQKVQSGKYDIKDCASFVLMRLFFRNLKLREFQALFQKKVVLENPDDIAAVSTALLLRGK